MSKPEVLPIDFAVPVTAYAFNADRSQLAVCPNSNVLQIYQKSANTWTLSAELKEHDKLITSVDWAPQSNRIVTCSQDRNAYVWTFQAGQWKPTLVLLRINRSATFVRWSPLENKFAVASGARAIAVCSFDPESDWWVAKHIKKPLRSTVLSLDWHPNNVLLVAGSADSRARVFSAYIKDVDLKPAPSVWGERLPFNTICGEYASPASGWIHSVSFTPSGNAIAFVSHDSNLSIIYPTGVDNPPSVFNVRLASLPHTSVTFLTEDSLIAAGHDCQPMLYRLINNNSWEFVKSLDDATGASQSNKASVAGRLNNTAFNAFKAADSMGATGGVTGVGAGDTVLTTVHQNTITSVRPFAGVPGNITHVSTAGRDGKIVIWDINSGGSGIAGLVKETSQMGL
ncbi:structural constituent of cytoskeleton [Wallemia mellicola]|uniref:Actin-related protein 2/3 complex subunit n=1 Tax=Wallemia mellicola TaxID=1708541 RepID=A0A4T0TVW0_9BASI|nr:structural constituent of cytoskeleton [Wallemia mellicola]